MGKFAETIKDVVDDFFIESGNVELLVQPLTWLFVKDKLLRQRKSGTKTCK
jgi:hypothetical protein